MLFMGEVSMPNEQEHHHQNCEMTAASCLMGKEDTGAKQTLPCTIYALSVSTPLIFRRVVLVIF